MKREENVITVVNVFVLSGKKENLLDAGANIIQGAGCHFLLYLVHSSFEQCTFRIQESFF